MEVHTPSARRAPEVKLGLSYSRSLSLFLSDRVGSEEDQLVERLRCRHLVEGLEARTSEKQICVPAKGSYCSPTRELVLPFAREFYPDINGKLRWIGAIVTPSLKYQGLSAKHFVGSSRVLGFRAQSVFFFKIVVQPPGSAAAGVGL